MKVEQESLGTDELFRFANQLARRYGRIGTMDPEDMAQNAMLKLLQRTGHRPPTKGWMYKVVRSAAYDAGRTYSRDVRNFLMMKEQLSVRTVCERGDEDEYVYVRRAYIASEEEPDMDIIPRLQAMLAQLAEPLRRVLVLYAQGFSYQQIAELTNCSVGTVRSRLFHARRRAQLLLNDIA